MPCVSRGPYECGPDCPPLPGPCSSATDNRNSSGGPIGRPLVGQSARLHIDLDQREAPDIANVTRLMVAVGTRISPRPPHRSRRALLTHRAPPSGSGVEAVAGQRVYSSDWRKEAGDELDEPLQLRRAVWLRRLSAASQCRFTLLKNHRLGWLPETAK
jgi:hypothetical protein